MLVLTRKLGQVILIGEDVAIKVVKIDHNKIQLGISAPSEVLVFRQELVDKIKKFNRIAARTDHQRLMKAASMFKQLLKLK